METSSDNKLCVQFNIAPHYRESIFKLINDTFSCDWYFGENKTNIKSMDTSALHDVKILKNVSLFKGLFYRKGLSSLIDKDEYNTFLITAESFNLSMWWMLLKAHFLYPKKRVYLWTHGLYGKEGWFIKLLKKTYLKLASGVFLYGNYAKHVMLEEGFDEDKLYVIHNSLQYEEHLNIRCNIQKKGIYKEHFGNQNHNIIFIGRLTKVKRLDFIVNALKVLIDRNVGCNLTFIGDGPEKEKLEKLVREKGLSDNVWFYGACYDDKINAELIYNADLCVAPGNVGLTALHTMTFGTPVITHDNFSYQMPEFETVRKGMTGDFFKQGSMDSLIDCIDNWFKEHTDRDVVRQNCYHEIEESWTPEFQIKVLKEHLEF